MKNILVILLMLIYSATQATTYFVSNAGNNSTDGTSIATSWQTLSKVVGTTFTLGDTVKLKCGDIWTETFNLASGNVVIASYGTGSKPEIRGWGSFAAAKTSGNWSEYSPGIWRMTSGNFGTRLWLNGKEVKESKTTTLTTEYRWHYDGTYFYLKSPSNPAIYFNSITISTGSKYDLVTITGKQNIVFDGINFSGSRYCLRLTNIKNWEIKNCEIGYRTNETGLLVIGLDGDSCVNVIIRNNVINCGDSLNYNYYRKNGTIRPLDMTTADAINIGDNTSNCIVSSNYIYGWSHCGIYFLGAMRNNHAYENFITAPFVAYARGVSIGSASAISCSMHHNTIVNTSVQNQLNSTGSFDFYKNIIENVSGTTFPEKQYIGNGIAIEAFASTVIGMNIHENVIINCRDRGIKIQGGSPYVVTGNTIRDNIIVNNGTDVNYNHQLSVALNSGLNTNVYSNNHLYSNIFTDLLSYRSANYSVENFNAITTTNGDVISGNTNSIVFPVTGVGNRTVALNEFRVLHNETAVNKIVKLAYSSVALDGTKYTTSVTIPPYSSKIIVKSLAKYQTVGGVKMKYNGKWLKF